MAALSAAPLPSSWLRLSPLWWGFVLQHKTLCPFAQWKHPSLSTMQVCGFVNFEDFDFDTGGATLSLSNF